MSLGGRLSETARSLLALQKKARSPAEKQQLAWQLQQLLTRTGQLVDAKVAGATREYDAANQGLERAQRALAAALQDLARVPAAIELTAKALDLLAKLAALAA